MGTAGELSISGIFYEAGEDGRTGLQQVNITDFVQIIASFVNDTKEEMKIFEERNKTEKLWEKY